MALKIGIVGLPNVGKSTLFNALTRTKSAQAANYPFCTIDPNIGIVEVPDERLDQLSKTSGSAKVIPAAIEFVDIAGLVKGASQGEGLGNKFLANIRECDAIGHVVRFFEDSNVTHVHDEVDPQLDREVIESELLLADAQTMENRLAKATSESKSGNKEKIQYAKLLEKVLDHINSGKLASEVELEEDERELLKDLHLLTSKPHLYIINLHEDELSDGIDVQNYTTKLGLPNSDKVIPICAKVEEELGDFGPEESKEYIESLGLKDTGLNSLIQTAYDTLGLHTYFTSGEQETRAWTVNKGSLAPQAAGKIHTDFEKGFIKADVVDWKKLVDAGGEVKARDLGHIRLEGKDYIVQDGDVMHFKFSN